MAQELRVLSDRYALEELIARGGMASVYRARDEVLARAVAVKILHPELVEDGTFLERFQREALAAARLTHPNIVSIYDTGTEASDNGPAHFIVMEFCSRGTLGRLLEDEGPLDPERVAMIGRSICDALEYAHRNEVVHRDIKPANVLISDDGTIKVADFGIAKAAFSGHDLTTSGSMLGTVRYVSPEQARGIEPDARSDIYSLGVVLYELLCGRPPFDEESPVATAMKHASEPVPPPRSLKAGIPRELEAAILHSLEKDPEDRPTSAAEFQTELGFAGGATAVMGRPPVPPTPTPTGGRDDARWVTRVVGLIVAVVVVALGITWLLAGDREGGGGSSGGRSSGSDTALDISAASDFDPDGGDGEHPEDVDLAFDGNPATFWTTETYNEPLPTPDKDGVGLVFDLGDSQDVGDVEITTTTPGIDVEIRTSDSQGTTEDDYDVAATDDDIGSRATIAANSSGRYWLIWITGFPSDGGGPATIAEVRFLAG